jgi:hypothetical protein
LPPGVTVDGRGNGAWAIERIDGHEIRWRALFCNEPLEDEEFQGFSIFANRKLIQTSFWFRLQGGLAQIFQ